jgi:hypothetical protein
MSAGKNELSKSAGVYFAGLAFALTYLLTTIFGGSGMTAVIRSTVVAVLTMLVGSYLIRPVIDTILDAIARDEANKPSAEDAK